MAGKIWKFRKSSKEEKVSEKQGRQGRKVFRTIDTLLEKSKDIAKRAAKPVLGGLLVVGTTATISSCGPKNEYTTIKNYYNNETTEYSLTVTPPTQYGNEATQEEEKREIKFQSASAEADMRVGSNLDLGPVAVKLEDITDDGDLIYIIGAPQALSENKASAYAKIYNSSDEAIFLDDNMGVFIHAKQSNEQVVEEGKAAFYLEFFDYTSPVTTLDVGESLYADGYVIKLDDLDKNDGSAIFSIYDENGELISQEKVQQGRDLYLYYAPVGKDLRLSVIETAMGYTLSTKWAKIEANTSTHVQTPELDVGDTYPIDTTYSITLDDITYDSRAVYSLETTDGTYFTDVIGEDEKRNTSLNGKHVSIRANSIIPPETEIVSEDTYARLFHRDKAALDSVGVGEALETPNYYVELSDVRTDDGIYAVFDIYEKGTGNRVAMSVGYAGKEVELGVGNGKKIVIYTAQIAPGYTFGNKWARFFVEEADN